MTAITQKQLGKKIQDLRENMGVSQEVLAKHLGVTRQAIGQIEKGERKIDGLELAKISDFFSLTIDEVFKTTITKKTKFEAPKNKKISEFSPEKLENLMLYILKQCGGKPNLGETVLYKLLYFIDFDSFETFGAPVTGMTYLKLHYGPVPRKKDYEPVIKEMVEKGKLNIFAHEYYEKVQKRYIALAEPNLKMFSATELEIINKVINRLSDMNATEITDYVHDDIPWEITPNGMIIDYNLVFEREAPYASRNYPELFQDATGKDVLEELGPMTRDEAEYYRKL